MNKGYLTGAQCAWQCVWQCVPTSVANERPPGMLPGLGPGSSARQSRSVSTLCAAHGLEKAFESTLA
jgi:hypothetical protein